MDFFCTHMAGNEPFFFQNGLILVGFPFVFSPPRKKQHRKRSRQKKQPPFFWCKKLGFLLRNHWINVGKRYLAQRHKGTKLSDVFGPCPGFFWKCLRVGTDPKNFRTKSKHQHGFFSIFLNLPGVCGDGNLTIFSPGVVILFFKAVNYLFSRLLVGHGKPAFYKRGRLQISRGKISSKLWMEFPICIFFCIDLDNF